MENREVQLNAPETCKPVKATGAQLGPEFYLSDLEYADDIAVLNVLPADLQSVLNRISSCASIVGLKINTRKTKYFTTASGPQLPLVIGESLGQVDSFRYLGFVLLPSGQAEDEYCERLLTGIYSTNEDSARELRNKPTPACPLETAVESPEQRRK